MRIADQRKCRAEVDSAIRCSEDSGSDYSPAAVDSDNPLVRKMLDIQLRLQAKNREPD